MKKLFAILLFTTGILAIVAWRRPDVYEQARTRFPFLPKIKLQVEFDEPATETVFVNTGEFIPVDEETFRYIERLHNAATQRDTPQ